MFYFGQNIFSSVQNICTNPFGDENVTHLQESIVNYLYMEKNAIFILYDYVSFGIKYRYIKIIEIKTIEKI